MIDRLKYDGLEILNKPRILADSEWMTIEPLLLKKLEIHKQRKEAAAAALKEQQDRINLVEAKRQLWRPRLETLQAAFPEYMEGDKKFPMSLANVFALPEVKTVLEEVDDNSITEHFLRTRFTPLMPTLIVRWRETIHDKLTAYVTDTLSSSKLLSAEDINVNPLSLALARFQCVICLEGGYHPDIVGHECSSSPMQPRTSRRRHQQHQYHYLDFYVEPLKAEYEQRKYETTVSEVYVEQPMWICDNIKMLSLGGKAKAVIKECGLDPAVATPEDMDRHAGDMLLECPTCVGAMDWREAVCLFLFL